MRLVFGGLSICLALVLVVAGCNGGGDADLPDLVPVSGTVTLDGEPCPGVGLTFYPVGTTAGGVCYATSDDAGLYTLTDTEGREGATEGKFKVGCDKWVNEDGSLYSDEESGMSPMMAGAKRGLAVKYAEEDTTDIEVTVPVGGGTIDIQLQSDK